MALPLIPFPPLPSPPLPSSSPLYQIFTPMAQMRITDLNTQLQLSLVAVSAAKDEARAAADKIDALQAAKYEATEKLAVSMCLPPEIDSLLVGAVVQSGGDEEEIPVLTGFWLWGCVGVCVLVSRSAGAECRVQDVQGHEPEPHPDCRPAAAGARV